MRIDGPSFSGSINQAPSAYATLSGSFTGSFTGSFKGDIEVTSAEFTNLSVKDSLRLGYQKGNTTQYVLVASGSLAVSGSIDIQGGSFNVDGVSVLDSAIAFAIALG
jgi:D-serine dehydratase